MEHAHIEQTDTSNDRLRTTRENTARRTQNKIGRFNLKKKRGITW